MLFRSNINYNMGDIDLGLTSSYSADDRKKMLASVDYNKQFGPLKLTSDLTYDVLNENPALDVGLQYDLAGDGTLKFGGEFDERGQNVGFTIRKPLRKKPQILGKYAKGGLARILGV